MGGDYTRLTFDPRRDHAGVLMQQGRVQLDADWNELVALLDRRLRAETVDIIGRCVVPRETPDGFRIQVGGGDLTIGPGRMYVDGLLAENHGSAPDEFDATLAETKGSAPLSYAAQPYFPGAADLAPLPSAGPHLAYLDVWQREVTALEEPELVDKAVAVDTATRLQTVWQVRLLADVGDVTCETADEDLPGWPELLQPSAGRLTTAAVGVPSSDDPCTIPADGGYRGPENRLYRVEIHEPGPLGTATFKWSRDNGSVATAVTAIDPARTELTVVRVGRDAVLRFAAGDQVEVTDDRRVLAGLPGEIRTIANVDEVTQRLTLDAALPSGEFDASDPDRHTLVRRWDHVGSADALQTVPADGSPVVIDPQAGVQLTFSDDPDGGNLRTADYWVFAARTADASVEELQDAPPRGISHHYCRLAVVTFPGSATDCRTLWPPDTAEGCDCSVCVSAESHNSGALTIQHALDQVRTTGGKVCLGPGLYRLERGLELSGGRSVTVEGRGWRTILSAPGTMAALSIENSVGVSIRELTIITSSRGRTTRATVGGTAVALRNCAGVTIERCVLLQSSFIRAGATHLAAATMRLASPFVASKAAGGPAIGLNGFVLLTTLRENVVVATAGVGNLSARPKLDLASARSMDLLLPTARERASRASYLLTGGLVIEDNFLRCDRTGVSLEGFSLHMSETRIAGNTVQGCSRSGVVATGVVSPGGHLDLTGNTINVRGDAIVVGVDDVLVAHNSIGRPGTSADPLSQDAAATVARAPVTSTGSGIVLGPGLGPVGLDRCQVRANRITGIGGDGISVRTRIGSAAIGENVIGGVGGGGIVMTDAASADGVTIAGNDVLGVAGSPAAGTPAVGVRVLKARRVDVAGNTVAGVGVDAVESASRTGIEVLGSISIRIAGNEVVDIGPTGDFVNVSLGVAVGAGFDRLDVVDNVVRRSVAVPTDPGSSQWFALRVGAPPVLQGAFALLEHTVDLATEPAAAATEANQPAVPSTEPASGLFAPATFQLADVASSQPTLVDLAGSSVVAAVADSGILLGLDAIAVFPRGREIVGVRGNLLEARGLAPAAAVFGNGACAFNDNRCLLAAPERRLVAFVRGRSLIVGSNYAEGPPGGIGLALSIPDQGLCTVLGNVATGPIRLNGVALPAPWNVLNQTA